MKKSTVLIALAIVIFVFGVLPLVAMADVNVTELSVSCDKNKPQPTSTPTISSQEIAAAKTDPRAAISLAEKTPCNGRTWITYKATYVSSSSKSSSSASSILSLSSQSSASSVKSYSTLEFGKPEGVAPVKYSIKRNDFPFDYTSSKSIVTYTPNTPFAESEIVSVAALYEDGTQSDYIEAKKQ